MNRIGLCMIVKDEAHVIDRCLRSVREHIDHWVVVDTGSRDGTQRKVHELLAGVPGFLLERPWRDFGHNRTEALEAARPHAEYSFVIDADEVLLAEPGFSWPELTADIVNLRHRTGSTVFWSGSLLANHLPWRYVGVLHEYPDSGGAATSERIDAPEVVGHFDGGRGLGLSSVEKYRHDARTLEAALLGEPDNARYQYYLARSYQAAEQFDAALSAHRRHVEMTGAGEAAWDSLLSIARLLEPAAGADEVIAAYLRAWENRPGRAESLTCLARFCRMQGRFALGRSFAAQAMQIPRPTADSLWIEEDVYEWACLDEFAVSSYWTGDFQDCADVCRELLERRRLPEAERARVLSNLEFAQHRLSGASVDPRVPRQAAVALDLRPPRQAGPTEDVAAAPAPGIADPLWALLRPRRRTAVVDVGANPTDGEPPYRSMLRDGLCTVVGFEPNPEALDRLQQTAGPEETYLPWALGDGGRHTLHICAAEAMSSLLTPDAAALDQLHLFPAFAEVVRTVEVNTRRLDDLTQIGPVDLLKVAVQGSELMVIRSGRVALRDAVAVHTDISFLNLYRGQPTFGEVDAELRSAGFVPHVLQQLKRWALTPLVVGGDPRRAGNQLLDADLVYVRDLSAPGVLTNEQLKHLALIAHHCYGSYDLVARCLHELQNRESVAADSLDVYCALVSTLGVPASMAVAR